MYLSQSLQSTRFSIPDGEAGIIRTVDIMRDMVDQYKASLPIRGLALALIQFLPGKDEHGEIDLLFQWVRDNIRYVKDINGVETVSTPDRTLEFGQGDCDDKSVLLASLLQSVGYDTCFVIAGYNGHEFQHVYVAVNLHDQIISMDTTENESLGWEPPNPTVKRYL